MKTVLGTLLLCFALSAQALDVSRYHSGSWFNPGQNGHGFSVEVLPDGRVLFYWYTYHPDGRPAFIVAIGEPVLNKVTAQAYYSSGMVFGDFDPATRTQVEWGTITLEFGSCDSAILTYDSDLEYEGVPWGSGTITLTRLSTIDGTQCSDVPEAGLFQGEFVSSETGEAISGLVIVAPNGEFAVVRTGQFAAVGEWSNRGINFTAGGTAVSAEFGNPFEGALSMSGQLSPNYRMVGSYGIAEVDGGRYDLVAVSELYRQALPLESLAGSYTFQDVVTGVSGTATIAADGTFAATDTAECEFAGELSVPDEEFNQVAVSLTVSECLQDDTGFTGYGAIIDLYDLGDGRVLRLVTTDGETARLLDLYR